MSGSPVEAWAASGGMWLTGHGDGPPLAVDVDVLGAAQERLQDGLDAATFLFGRAPLLGLSRAGRRSAGGSCRLLRAADGWVAVSLARPEDVASIPAILEREVDDDAEAELEDAAGSMPGAVLAERSQLLGVPAAVLGAAAEVEAVRVVPIGERGALPDTPRVVDLSSLWAGPLCAHLLGLAGADIVKVESTTRPDGARQTPSFFAWLHAGHESVVVDFATGREELRRLIDEADVVIEASRPRALRQLGIDADDVVRAGRGKTWVSITGYGRDGAWSDRVAFGDDAAVAGGLVARDADGDPVFLGDAVADPLSGIYAAHAVRSALASGGGVRIDVAMAGVAGDVAARRVEVEEHAVVADADGAWTLELGDRRIPVERPRPPA